MNISLRQLKCFVAVAQHQNFTRAAQELHTTQSAVSLIIKELEEEVGFRLFDRTTRQVALSDAGSEFYRTASRLLDEFQAVVRDASDMAALRKGVVRVGATEAVACSLMVPAIAQYQQHRLGIDVHLEVTLVPSMFQALRQGEVDIIVGPDSIRPDEIDRAVVGEPISPHPLWVWCLPSHPFAQLLQVPWQAVLQGDLIIPALDFNSGILPAIAAHLDSREFEKGSFSPVARRRSVANITAALSMVKAGLGTTFAAEYIRPLAETFGLVGRELVEPGLERHLVLYTRRGKSLSPAASDFTAFFRQVLAKIEFS